VIFLDRAKREAGPHLEWRVRLFWAGALLALVGIYWEIGPVIWAAITLLFVGVFLRFVPDGARGRGAEVEENLTTDETEPTA
jgi:hypothetical protein